MPAATSGGSAAGALGRLRNAGDRQADHVGHLRPQVGVVDEHPTPELHVAAGRGLERELEAFLDRRPVDRAFEIQSLAHGAGGGQCLVEFHRTLLSFGSQRKHRERCATRRSVVCPRAAPGYAAVSAPKGVSTMDVWTGPTDRYYYGWYDAASGPLGPPPTDGQIKAEAVDRLRKNPNTVDSDLLVDVKRAVVILRGSVPDRRAKRSAGDDCWDILGVRDVSNLLDVDAGPGEDHGTVADVMSSPAHLALTTDSCGHVASIMRDDDIGFVVVVDDRGRPAGVVTDRDLVTRAVAEGIGPDAPVDSVITGEPASIDSGRPVSEAVSMMRAFAVRRLPVVHDGAIVGVVTLGDLARERDPGSALAEISGAPAN